MELQEADNLMLPVVGCYIPMTVRTVTLGVRTLDGATAGSRHNAEDWYISGTVQFKKEVVRLIVIANTQCNTPWLPRRDCLSAILVACFQLLKR